MNRVFLLCSWSQSDGALKAVNAIEWDGVSPYVPAPGQFLIEKQGDEWTGWTFAAGQWSPPPQPPQEAQTDAPAQG